MSNNIPSFGDIKSITGLVSYIFISLIFFIGFVLYCLINANSQSAFEFLLWTFIIFACFYLLLFVTIIYSVWTNKARRKFGLDEVDIEKYKRDSQEFIKGISKESLRQEAIHLYNIMILYIIVYFLFREKYGTKPEESGIAQLWETYLGGTEAVRKLNEKNTYKKNIMNVLKESEDRVKALRKKNPKEEVLEKLEKLFSAAIKDLENF